MKKFLLELWVKLSLNCGKLHVGYYLGTVCFIYSAYVLFTGNTIFGRMQSDLGDPGEVAVFFMMAGIFCFLVAWVLRKN